MVMKTVCLCLLLGAADALNILASPEGYWNAKLKVANMDIMHLDGKNHSFGIERDNFVWDGKPVQLQAGEMHYFRIPSMYWKDRILRAKAMGMNAIQTYVPWNFHEQDEGQYDFSSEMHDIVKFLQIAKEADMPVVFRPGPYICAEWTGGGLPGWLQSKPGLQLRTYENQYIASVTKWWDKLLPMIKPELAENGGAIIMVQLENEYGVLGDTVNNKNDKRYIEHLRDLAVKHLGHSAQLFTDDPAFGGNPINEAMFKRGGIPGVFRAINLGPQDINNDDAWRAAKAVQRHMNAHGKAPFYVAETYSGWFSKWEDDHITRKKTGALSKAMRRIKDDGGSLGLYMIHGGTNFGFWAGANDGSFITSYDYNAPISEAGNHGYGLEGKDKYEALKQVFGAGRELPAEPPQPVFQALPEAQASYAASLREEMDSLCSWRKTGGPRAAEHYGFQLGLMAYRFESSTVDMSMQKVEAKASDTTHMWLNGRFVTAAKGPFKNVNLKVTTPVETQIGDNATLEIVVDTMGRSNFGMEKKQMHDTRGLWHAKVNGQFLAGNNGQWSVCNLRLDDVSKLDEVAAKRSRRTAGPSFFSAQVQVTDATKDTFLHPVDGFGKGVAFVNGFNLGRYDTSSALKDLYIPASALKQGTNNILMLETDAESLKRESKKLEFLDKRMTRT